MNGVREMGGYRAVDVPDDGPLLLALHGTGGTGEDMAGLARQLMHGAHVIAPTGDVSEHGAPRFFRRTGEGVYDMDDLARAVEKMGIFVNALRAAHPDKPLFAFGYSNGANILAATAMAAPDLFDRIGLLHPLIPWSPHAVPGLAGTPVLLTAGERDPICPMPLTEDLIGWLEAQGADLSTLIHRGGHELRVEELHALSAFLKGEEE